MRRINNNPYRTHKRFTKDSLDKFIDEYINSSYLIADMARKYAMPYGQAYYILSTVEFAQRKHSNGLDSDNAFVKFPLWKRDAIRYFYKYSNSTLKQAAKRYNCSKKAIFNCL